EARRVHERVRLFVTAPEPPEGLPLEVVGDEHHSQAARPFQTVEEVDGRSMPRSAPQQRPALAANLVRRHERGLRAATEQLHGLVMSLIAREAKGDPEGGVNKDHAPSTGP